MGRLEEYTLWKKGELNKKMSRETIDIFKTNPTEEQLLAFDAYDKRILIIFLFGIFTYLIIGLIWGFTLGAV